MTMPVSAKTRESTEPGTLSVAGVGAFSALLFSLALFNQWLIVAALVVPFPLAVLRLRGSRGAAAMAAVLGAALLGTLFSAGQALSFLLLLAAPGLLIGEAMARGRGLVRGAAWAFALLSLEIGAALFFNGPEMATQAVKPLDAYTSPRVVDELRSGGVSAEYAESWVGEAVAVRDALAVVYPAAYIIMGGVLVVINASLLRLYLARRDPGWLEGGEFERIRWPIGLAAAFVLFGFAVALEPVRPLAYNALLIIAFFLALQGLAVVGFYARRLAAPPLLRVAVVVLILANPWAPRVLALLGLFDAWIDFRKWAEPPPPRREGI